MMNVQILRAFQRTGGRTFHFSAIRLVSRPTPEIDSIIRVDHAGELGADRIYAGQMAILGKSKMGPLIQHMWDQEKVHKATFERLIIKYRVRPTAFVPIWNVAGFMLGAGTALMGEKAAMACTVAVESVIVDHYNDQLRTLMADPEPNKELLETIQKFRDEEQEHHDCGLDNGAEQAPFYKALTEVIKVGCKTAIAISKGLFPNRSYSSHVIYRSYSSSAAQQANKKWDLYSAVCLERKPLITRPLTDLQIRYKQLIEQLETEESRKSNTELRIEEEERTLANKKKESEDVMTKQTSVVTAYDLSVTYTEELQNFKFASRITEADRKNDVKSTQRKLDSHLLLLIHEKLGDEFKWALPFGIRQDEETMRQTAERILHEKCGDTLKTVFMGNAPCGFFKYKYPNGISDSYGAKIFFFKALYLGGQVKANAINDYQWSSRTELPQLIDHKKYLEAVKSFLIDEEDAVAQDLAELK